MSDIAASHVFAADVPTSDGATSADADPDSGDDAQWLAAFLLAHRGKTFRVDVDPGSEAGRASAHPVPVPDDVIDAVVRAAR